jgi:hypothetical protein
MHGREGIEDEEGSDCTMAEGGDCSVSETEAAHDHIPGLPFQVGQAEIGQGHFCFVKEARHEKGVAQFDLENLHSA